MTNALSFITTVAPRLGGTCHQQPNEDSLDLSLPIEHVDGFVIVYDLIIKQADDGLSLKVQEYKPLKLPAFCPQRHINHDGTFCLGYGDDFSTRIDTEDSAMIWLETLYSYLKQQRRAERHRRWQGPEWRHGHAAEHQKKAMAAAAQIIPDLNFSELSIRVTSSKNRKIVEVLHCDESILRVWKNDQRIVNAKQPCICKSPKKKKRKRFGRCQNHAQLANELAIELEQMEIAEKEYWFQFIKQKVHCCKSCDNCPLLETTP